MAELKRELNSFSSTLLVAGNMIGIGIFVTAGRIYALLPSPVWIFTAWIFGGVLAIFGALAYAELGTRFPRAGGPYIYLRETFGELWGFLSGFAASWVSLPGAVAFLAIGFCKYSGIADGWTTKLVSVGLILIISFINYLGVVWGAKLQDLFMVIKLSLIVALVVAGFLSGNGSWQNLVLSGAFTKSVWVAFPLALVPVMYTFSGWDATAYIAGEINHPRRTIPFAVLWGTLLVLAVYLALVAFYIYAIPVTVSNPTKIVAAASTVLFGGIIGKIVSGLVAVSILGALSATILTAPRVIYAMAQDGLLPSSVADVHARHHTPAKAIWALGLWSCVLALTGTFDQLLDYVTVPSVFFNAMIVLGLFRARKKNHSDHNADIYLMPGYPWMPLLFVMGIGWIVLNTIIKAPMDSVWGLVIVALGVPIYFLWKRYKKTRLS